MPNGFYEIVANHKTDTLGHRSCVFETKRKAINYAKWLAQQHYVSMVQIYHGGAGGEIVYEIRN